MENPTFWTVTAKWTAIYIGFQLLVGLFFQLTFDSRAGTSGVEAFFFGLISVGSYIVQFVILLLAYRDYDRQNTVPIRAGQAFGIAGLMILASFIISLISQAFMGEEVSEYLTEEMYWRARMIQVLISAIMMTIFILFIGIWRLFQKAGQPGWASIVPIYNAIVMLEIARLPAWWFFLLLIPFVNIIIAVRIAHGLSEAFGKDTAFTVGLVLLPFVFYPILGFGSDRWIYGPDEEYPADGWQLEDNLVP